MPDVAKLGEERLRVQGGGYHGRAGYAPGEHPKLFAPGGGAGRVNELAKPLHVLDLIADVHVVALPLGRDRSGRDPDSAR
jgi:hypothetical protein